MVTLSEHITWLSYILNYVPSLRDRVQRLRSMGRNRTKARFEAGAESKDVFYYLVSHIATQLPLKCSIG